MGKTSLCIQMLQILNSGRVYKVSELAGLLDTNPRNIIEYKKELEECGYYVNTIPGRYGGYQLDKSYTLPVIKFNKEELSALDDGFNYLLKRNDFLNKDIYQKAFSKIYSTLNRKAYDNSLLVINRYPLSMSEDDLKFRFETIQDGIASRKKLKMTYVSQKNYEKEYIFHPYDMFMYNNAWFVIGWNEYYNDVLYFKINRISHIEKTTDSFRILRGFDLNNYVDEHGFKSDNEWFHVEFIAKGNYASLVKERIYGKNQIVEVIDQKNTKVSVDMKNRQQILTFILGFGNDIEVLQPQCIIEDMVDVAKQIISKYQNINKI